MEWQLLASLAEAERRAVLTAARRCEFVRGDAVVREGEPSDSLHLVESGRLAVRVTTVDGDTATLNVLGPGDYFGELSLLDGRPPKGVVRLGRGRITVVDRRGLACRAT